MIRGDTSYVRIHRGSSDRDSVCAKLCFLLRALLYPLCYGHLPAVASYTAQNGHMTSMQEVWKRRAHSNGIVKSDLERPNADVLACWRKRDTSMRRDAPEKQQTSPLQRHVSQRERVYGKGGRPSIAVRVQSRAILVDGPRDSIVLF